MLQERELSSRAASFADDGEILDGMVTRGRGEFRRICSLKLGSSSATPTKEFKTYRSFEDKVYSPRVSELRGEQSPSPRFASGPRTGEARPSNLGKSG